VSRGLVEISIYIGDREYGVRYWPAVPRAGDDVVLRRVEDGKVFGDGVVTVETVCWGTSKESRQGLDGELRVSLLCNWRDPQGTCGA
jgi:hypothetical protein